MNLFRETRPNVIKKARVLSLVSVLGLSLFGCGQSAEEKAKEDEQGKKTNEQGMMRMMQEQGIQPQQPGQPGMAPAGQPGMMQPGQPGMAQPGMGTPPGGGRMDK